MASSNELLSVYQDILRNLTVNWQRQFSPTINFGYNVHDVNVEQHVLDEVGSYGSQLNRIIDLLSVLLPRVIDAKQRQSLTPAERSMVEKFEDLARRADTAAAAYKRESPKAITRAEIERFVQGMRELERADEALYGTLLKRLYEELPPAVAATPKR